MRELPLRNSSRKALIDDEDYDRVMLYKWSITDKYIRKTTAPMIRLSKYVMNDPVNTYDHKDRNILNNQKDNLRIATTLQNSYNRGKRDNFKPCSSQYKGVSWNKRDKRWQASIRYNKRSISLGYFKKEELAARAYDKAALKYHGEFAVLNFPKEDYL